MEPPNGGCGARFWFYNEVLPSIHALFDEYAEDINLYHLAFPEDWLEQLRK